MTSLFHILSSYELSEMQRQAGRCSIPLKVTFFAKITYRSNSSVTHPVIGQKPILCDNNAKKYFLADY